MLPHPQACFKPFRVSPVLLNRPWEVLWGPTSACSPCRIQLFPFSLSSPCSSLPGTSPVFTLFPSATGLLHVLFPMPRCSSFSFPSHLSSTITPLTSRLANYVQTVAHFSVL